MLEIVLVPMTVEDLDQVMAVEHTSFITPWSRAAFIGELTQNVFANYLVAKAGEQVVGYGGVWIVLDEAHVTNVAVHEAHRGQKIGERLMLALIQTARSKGARRMTLEVRSTNSVAQNLYQKLGFVARGVRRSYYSDTQEDAIVMWKDEL